MAGFRVHEGQKSENRLAYCNEAHRLTGVEKIINKLKIYKIINRILKEKEQVIDIRTLVPIFLYVMLWNSQEVVKEDDMGHNVLKSKLQKIGKIE